MLLESDICKTRVGPSVVILTDKNPDPGRNLFRQIACSIGTPFAVRSWVTDNDGPNTTSFPIGFNEHIFSTHYKMSDRTSESRGIQSLSF